MADLSSMFFVFFVMYFLRVNICILKLSSSEFTFLSNNITDVTKISQKSTKL